MNYKLMLHFLSLGIFSAGVGMLVGVLGESLGAGNTVLATFLVTFLVYTILCELALDGKCILCRLERVKGE